MNKVLIIKDAKMLEVEDKDADELIAMIKDSFEFIKDMQTLKNELKLIGEDLPNEISEKLREINPELSSLLSRFFY